MSLMLRTALAACLVLPAVPALAQDRPAAHTNAETCLRENVAEAVRISSGATDSADFLLRYLCAEKVGYAAAYDQNTALMAAMKGMTSGLAGLAAEPSEDEVADEDAAAEDETFDFANLMGGDVSVDPVTGALVVPEGKSGMMAGLLQAQAGQLQNLLGAAPPVFLRQLAGQLVLQNRR
jgi:hypothetical protein